MSKPHVTLNMTIPQRGPATHRHIKTGGFYRKLAVGKLQTDMPLADGALLTVYVGEDGRWWLRPPAEMEDDERFSRVPVEQHDDTEGPHGLDTEDTVYFYEQEFYVLSNFSAFNLHWRGATYPTSEHAYQASKFLETAPGVARLIREEAASAHEAYMAAQDFKDKRHPDWDACKVKIMREILSAKVSQHGYVRKKLVETGNRRLIENSWRDSFWGWGPRRDGLNMLGRCWMEVRHLVNMGAL